MFTFLPPIGFTNAYTFTSLDFSYQNHFFVALILILVFILVRSTFFVEPKNDVEAAPPALNQKRRSRNFLHVINDSFDPSDKSCHKYLNTPCDCKCDFDCKRDENADYLLFYMIGCATFLTLYYFLFEWSF